MWEHVEITLSPTHPTTGSPHNLGESNDELRSSVNSSPSSQDESPIKPAKDGPSGSASWLSLLPESVAMAPQRPNLLPKDRFALAFGSLKTQSYHDPIVRAPGSHTYVFTAWSREAELDFVNIDLYRIESALSAGIPWAS